MGRQVREQSVTVVNDLLGFVQGSGSERKRFKRICVTLRTILASLAEGDRVEGILADCPTLTEADVRCVIAYAAASAAEDLGCLVCRPATRPGPHSSSES
ncbi:MAG: DUF433 domain-containing protein [Candidatus Eremiobacteraeota bacterium]|nr:DUF433 domain-containing protein [Candidatus Eremiobacteraeota bacterium]